MNTVSQLIKALKKYPEDMPVRIQARGDCRDGEYFKIYEVKKDHLDNQSTDGDPEEYWNDPSALEPEDRLKKGDVHFKYQGKLILIS
jgi:hypothetical protein